MNSRDLVRAFLASVLFTACHGCAPLFPPPQPARTLPAAPPAPRPLPLCGEPETGFIRNRGKFPGEVLYYVNGRAGSICFTRTAVRYLIGQGSPGGGFSLRFEGAGRRTELRAEKELRAGSDRTAGPRAFSTLTYRNLYKGIDLEYRAGRGGIERAFMVNPGVDPGIIRVACEGATELTVARDGGLIISTPHGNFTEKPPRAYQYISGEKVAVPGGFILAGDRMIGFALPRRDPRYLLVIDPAGAEGRAR
ncbi:MAG: hypothetical protein WCP22_08250 [Chlamydiota bacterium]